MLHLNGAQLLDGVDEQCLRPLLEAFEACELEPGDVLISPLEQNAHLYLVFAGELAVHLDSLDGHPVRLIGPGDCAGEISFMDDQPPSAYVLAREATVVLRVHRRSMSLLTRSPRLMQNLAELLCQRVRSSDRLIIDSEQNANIDQLTGAFNRRWLEHIYERESRRCLLEGLPLALLMLDVDHFKAYNDQHGHLAGDHALCMVVDTLGKLLRPADSLARYGGEEFVILLPGLALDDARNVGERLRQSLDTSGSFQSSIGTLPGVTISIGVAGMQQDQALDSLINLADQALYQAKAQGRNRVCG
jgi:diguanylate cyclase (GGDEF)-like protein